MTSFIMNIQQAAGQAAIQDRTAVCVNMNMQQDNGVDNVS